MRNRNDEIDDLLERMTQVAPPADFVERVMARSATEMGVERHPARFVAPLLGMLYCCALLVLVSLAYEMGATIASSGAGTLVATLIDDATAWADSPGAYFTAIVASVPWLQVAAVALDMLALTIITRLALRVAVSGHFRRQTGSRA